MISKHDENSPYEERSSTKKSCSAEELAEMGLAWTDFRKFGAQTKKVPFVITHFSGMT